MRAVYFGEGKLRCVKRAAFVIGPFDIIDEMDMVVMAFAYFDASHPGGLMRKLLH